MAGKQGVGIDLDVINKIANQVKKIHDLGVETGIVVGGGNFWRGRDAQTIDRATSDYMAMLGTIMKALALQDALDKVAVNTRCQTAMAMKAVA